MLSLKRRRLWKDLLPYGISVLQGGSQQRWDQTFYQGLLQQDKGKGFELKQVKFRLDTRKDIFTLEKPVKHWHRLPREVVDGPSLEVFMARLLRALDEDVPVD